MIPLILVVLLQSPNEKTCVMHRPHVAAAAPGRRTAPEAGAATQATLGHRTRYINETNCREDFRNPP